MISGIVGKLRKLARSSGGNRQQVVLIICHADDTAGNEVMDNICGGLAQAKIQFAVLDLKAGGSWPALDGFSAVVLSTEKISELGAAQTSLIVNYVEAGGGLLVAYRCWQPLLSGLFGFGVELDQPRFLSPGGHGLHFKEEVFTGARGLTIGDEHWGFEHCQIDILPNGLHDRCQVLITDGDGCPVAWQCDRMKGRVIYWNTTVLFCRALRGFLLQSLLSVMRAGVSAISGLGVIQIDDFPPSLSTASCEDAGAEFSNISRTEFYAGVWLPDMMELKGRCGLEFTCYTVMNYDDVDVSDLPSDAAPGHLSGTGHLTSRFSRIAHDAGGLEFGFHGYNHVPMTREGWPNLEVAESKLRLARKMWEKLLPHRMPVSYVPANNWYHAEHIRLIGSVFPEITTVCGLSSVGDPEMGEYREFAPEPWNSTILCLPRETFGYFLGPTERMMMLSQLGAMGCWTHFVHSDDVFDVPQPGQSSGYVRNPEKRPWRGEDSRGRKGMLAELHDWISTVQSLFPWLEFLTTSVAADRFRRHLQAPAQVWVSDGEVVIEGKSGGLYYVRVRDETELCMRGPGKIVDQRRVFGGTLYVVDCPAGRARFCFSPRRGLSGTRASEKASRGFHGLSC
ncbi:MAG: DUF2194 domain-containing protein [Hyphomicrobiales bacterium]|nr:DUF2194 domain-containing protein [Hyphomicrobiales bacterium]